MYACICHAVTVDEVETAIDAGCESVEEIGETTRAGTNCTMCHDHLDDIIEARCGSCPRKVLTHAAVA
ncbi:MAG TPA: (2Fe-2S)-binding protein [Jatrophihabitans sp.]|jgi:bacterioferritin-associated ferredoxin